MTKTTSDSKIDTRQDSSRRQFIGTTLSTAAAAASAGTIAFPCGVHAAGDDDLLRVGLIGCGGRGTGAARQALEADDKVKLVAMGDALAKGTNLNSYTVTEYLDVVKESSDAQKAWKTFMKYLERWKYFFPSGGTALPSRRMHRYYEVGKLVIGSKGEDSNG